jgi:hypothetical protein
MERLITIVESVMEFTGAVMPMPPAQHCDDFGSGSRILLRRPDGSTRETVVGGFPLANMARGIAFTIDATADEIPPGTEVWLIERKSDDDFEDD